MQRTVKVRVWLISAIIFFFTLCVTMVLIQLDNNLQFFISPSQLHNKKLYQTPIRLGGRVKPESIKIEDIVNKKIKFIVTDGTRNISVIYNGVISSIFKDNQGVVLDGFFDSEKKVFMANRLLAKHDEYYKPKGK